MTVQERFNELLEYLDMGPVQLARECNLRDGRITDITRGKVKKVAIDVADNITWKFPRISKDWLLYGIGEMTLDESEKEETKAPDYDTRINELLTICAIQQESISRLHEDIASLVSAIRALTATRYTYNDSATMVAEQAPKLKAYNIPEEQPNIKK